MENVLAHLIVEDRQTWKTLIFALGDASRRYFEEGLSSSPGVMSSVIATINSRRNIKVMFLSKLQYLYMFLNKFESARDEMEFNRLVIFGLDEILGYPIEEGLDSSQLRLAHLIFSVACRVEQTKSIEIQFVPSLPSSCEELDVLEQYWRELSSER
ncbi:LAMI_0G03796g1_1 [Lachancea mirantina]|uniref:LAMI_0G03796g1_1 n=1 Tax=Lachancea mirantina TaxID=1230905 RepID=A0A1G4K8G3_9SACH|nr:LAMI_0G03796g1_1 [Lachancea mirantina]